MPAPQSLKKVLKNETLENLRKMLINLWFEPNIQIEKLPAPELLALLPLIQIERPPYSFLDKCQITLPFFGALAITPGLPTLSNTIIESLNAATHWAIPLLPAVWWVPLLFLGVTMILSGINTRIKQNLVKQKEKEREKQDKLLTLREGISEVLAQKLNTPKYQGRIINRTKEILAAIHSKLGIPPLSFEQEIANWRDLSTADFIGQIKQMILSAMLQGPPEWEPVVTDVMQAIHTFSIEKTEEKEEGEKQALLQQRELQGLQEALNRFKHAPFIKKRHLPPPPPPTSMFKKWYPRVINAFGTALGVASIIVMFIFLHYALAIASLGLFVITLGGQLYAYYRSKFTEEKRKAIQSTLTGEIAKFTRSMIKRSQLEESDVAAYLPKKNYQAFMNLLEQLADRLEALPALSEVQPSPPPSGVAMTHPTEVQVFPPLIPRGMHHQMLMGQLAEMTDKVKVISQYNETIFRGSQALKQQLEATLSQPTGAAETHSSEVQDPPRTEDQQPAPLSSTARRAEIHNRYSSFFVTETTEAQPEEGVSPARTPTSQSP